MSGHRLRRWPNIRTTQVQRLVFAMVRAAEVAQVVTLSGTVLQFHAYDS